MTIQDNDDKIITGVTENQNSSIFYQLKKRHFIRYILIALFVAIILKTFFIEADTIPTESMENTLLAGDFIIVNKVSYAFSTPRFIPLTNIEIPSLKIFKTGTPRINDVVVFHFPGYMNEIEPDENIDFIKRIIGCPGDTLQIKNKVVFINNEKISSPSSSIISKTSFQKKGSRDPRIFPSGFDWNSDNYGPIVIPKKGMTIEINPKNINMWELVIDRELGDRAVSIEGTVITIFGRPVRSYTFKRNYFFVMGDYRDDSMDSRYWGFLSEDNIIGKAELIYWSWDISNSFTLKNIFSAVRWNRILKIIH